MNTRTVTSVGERAIGAIGSGFAPELGERYSQLKAEILKPEHYEALEESWKRLLTELDSEIEAIAAEGSNFIPQVEFNAIESNSNTIPDEYKKLLKERGCLIIRGVYSQEQALNWKKDFVDYLKSHPGLTGHPKGSPSNWFVHWSRTQVEARSHPRTIQLMKAVGKVYENDDPDALVDMSSQVVYPDRLRVRQPGKQVTLNLHVDSSSIERWEDPSYREVYKEIFEGEWEKWDPYQIAKRPAGVQDLYNGATNNGSTCSVFRAFQGWVALSHSKCGEGTIRFLPNMRTAIPYLLLRPFFWKDDGKLEFQSSKFPGATPGSGQLLAHDPGLFPHLKHDKSVVGIPYVNPGDFVLWHADLLHEVDRNHAGNMDSSVCFIAHTPLCPYNINTLKDSNRSFLDGSKPADFVYELQYGPCESSFEDRGQSKDVLSVDGKRALGLEKFDVDEPGLTAGQKKIRELANEALFSKE
ncbi:unnamed protein product [Kuraishia capsulata CBS 1993]|uniref:DUF1479-domain-containing protein n=1 Tax=Kuraishia capsulata CBS 1993 TaxID=1382522 RepID=W6MGJ7_9ASCO|nr:uncharacterized protein KUCA_T00001216001 [Kuraishia capsulata CBS 1993]CDK25249.1 unnamed protein product [Kuraishia capsulata CBS 1993]